MSVSSHLQCPAAVTVHHTGVIQPRADARRLPAGQRGQAGHHGRDAGAAGTQRQRCGGSGAAGAGAHADADDARLWGERDGAHEEGRRQRQVGCESSFDWRQGWWGSLGALQFSGEDAACGSSVSCDMDQHCFLALLFLYTFGHLCKLTKSQIHNLVADWFCCAR
jgi:hypothetical protein